MHTAPAQSDRLGLAIGAILITVFALSLGDAAIKGLSDGFVLWQIFVLRSAITLPVFVIAIARFANGAGFRPRAPGWMAVRVGLLVGMWAVYYVSLPHLPLSVAAAAYYTSPMFITLFSALLLGARVRALGWIAVWFGFLGVVIILRPGTECINWYVLLPLVSAVLYALAMILTRSKCRGEHALTLGFYLHVGFVLAGCVATGLSWLGAGEHPYLSAPWTPMGGQEWGVMALLALATLIGAVGAAVAYQNGPPQIIGVFDFAYVGFAVIWGAVFFGDLPDAWSMAGIGVIVLAGILAGRR